MKLMLRDHERDEEIIRLYEEDKLLYKQIAGKFNITEGRVGQLYRRAKVEKSKNGG